MNGSLRLAHTATAYALGRAKARFYPLKLLLEVTSACNLACVMCPHPVMTRSKQHMKVDLFQKIVDESRDFVQEYQLSLIGEPLLHPRIFEMIRYAKATGKFVSLFSNGTIMDEERCREIVESGLDRIVVTIDGATPETYAKVRVNGDLETTVGNLETLLHVKEEAGATTPEVVLQIIEMKETAAEIQAFVDRFSKLPLRLRVRPFDTHGGDERVMEHAPEGWDKKPLGRCTQLYSTMTVGSDGRVLPCCRDTEGTEPLGDLNTTSVLDVWWGGQAVDFRKRHRDSDLCAGCNESLRELAHVGTFLKRHLLPSR